METFFDSWTPPSSVTAHNGEALNPQQVFFHKPPSEIGAVTTAYTGFLTGKRPQPARQVLLAAVCAVAFAALGYFLVGLAFEGDPQRNQYAALTCLGCGALTFVIAYFCFGFKQVCSYVGERGVARFTIKKSLEAPAKAEIFLFERAANLLTGSTRQFVNGVYAGTSYKFKWTDENGGKVFEFNGRYHSKEGKPKIKDPYWLASSAEMAWTRYKVDWLRKVVETNGYAPFTYSGKNEVRVGPGFLEFVVKGQTHRITVPEIKHIKLAGGHFNIQHQEARWFRGAGKFSFPYASLTNARLFLHAMDKLVGYRFG